MMVPSSSLVDSAKGSNNFCIKELEEGVAGFQIEEFHNALDKELGIFGKNEKYSYVKDLKDAHTAALKTSTEEKILGTIPDHVFWDIKKPQN
jgi:hypothetical protein